MTLARKLRAPPESDITDIRRQTMSTRPSTPAPRTESLKIGPDDLRYRAVIEKRFNKRFHATPGYVRLVNSTEQVVEAVEEGWGRDGARGDERGIDSRV